MNTQNQDDNTITEKKKISIVIPTKNSLKYLKDNVLSIISQDYDNYELIISDNYSNDGTSEWIKSLDNPLIKLVKPETSLVMAENFEWALSHAKGEWIQILGSDDGVQPFYFQLADFLIGKAVEKHLSIINFPRAYFFWENCQDLYNDAGISFLARAGHTVKNTGYDLLSALISENCYFFIPHLYTMSITHHSVVEKVKDKMKRFFFTSCIHDASSAASICTVEKKYLQAFIPLTWVGTSKGSMGDLSDKSYERIKNEFLSDRLTWHYQMGGFYVSYNINEIHFYFYEAILQADLLQSFFWKRVYRAKWFKTLLFANVLVSIENSQQKVECLQKVLDLNKIPFKRVVFFRTRILPLVYKVFRRINRYFERNYRIETMDTIEYNLSRSPDSELSLMDAYRTIDELNKETGFVEKFIRART